MEDLNSRETGKKSILIALHGFLGEPWDWKKVESYFHSEKGKYGLSIDFLPLDYLNVPAFTVRQGEGLRGFSDAFALWMQTHILSIYKNVYLIGYSLGGRLALSTQLIHPERIRKTFVVSSHFGLFSEDEKYNRKTFDEVWALKFIKGPMDVVVREWMEQDIFKGGTAANPPSRLHRSWDTALLAYCLREWSLGNQELSFEAIRQRSSSLVWFYGDRDAKYLKLRQSLLCNVPNARNYIIEGASHRILWDQPEQLAQKVLVELADHSDLREKLAPLKSV